MKAAKNKAVPIALLIAIFAALFVANRNNVARTSSSGPIHIGAVLPLSGPIAGLGEALRQGYQWKVEELTKAGRTVYLHIEDSKSTAKDGVNAFTKLADIDKVPVVFTTMSSVAMSLKPIADQRSVLLWANATHPDLTASGGLVLRHSNTTERDAVVMADKIIDLNRKRTGILFQNDEWGIVASEQLSERLARSSVVALSIGIDNKASDFRADLTRLIGQKIDSLIIITAGPAAGILVKQARELGFKGDIISSVGIVLTPEVQVLAGPHLKGTYYETYELSPEFVADYRARFSSEPQAFAQVAYTDVELLMNAINATGTYDPIQIARYVKGLRSFDGTYEKVSITPSGDIIVPTVIKKFE